MANDPASIRQTLDQNGAIWMDYSGDSMLPTLISGSALLLERADAVGVKEGDLIAFEVQGKDEIVVHRLIKKIHPSDSGLFITKADNYPYLDQDVQKGHIIGRISRVRKSGSAKDLPVAPNSFNSRIYLLLGNILLFARQKKKAVPRPLHAPLEKTFTICHNLLKTLAR